MDEVLIIGAGAAGLAAGRVLCGHGISARIVDARERIGGRIYTIREQDLPLPIEGGAEFVHGLPEATWDIIRSAQLPAADVPDTHVHLIDDKIRRTDDFWDRVDEVMQRLKSLKQDMSFAEFLRSQCSDVPEATRQLARGYIEGFNAADVERISAIGVRQAEAEQEKIEADRNHRLIGGYDGVLRYLAAGIDPRRIQLNTLVRRIKWKPGRVEVEATVLGENVHLVARRLVVTLPIGVLQAKPGTTGAVEWEPRPTESLEAAANLAMGSVLKIVIAFREPLWEAREDLRDVAFVHSQSGDAAFPTWWSTLPVRSNVLVGWAGGPPGERLSGTGQEELLRRALGDLAKITGRAVGELATRVQWWRAFDWPADPLARGAYSYVPLGGLDAIERLRRPVKQTLYFAGEATDDQMSGTVAGAIASGVRVAQMIAGKGDEAS